MNNRQQSITRNSQCIECSKTITGVAYSFAGGLACEKCVRTYYRKNGHPDDLQLELRERATAAERMIKHFERSKKAR
jgi:hypothetical protein